MTRINDSTLIQRVDDDLVLLNESTGAEVFVEERRRQIEPGRARVRFPTDLVYAILSTIDDYLEANPE